MDLLLDFAKVNNDLIHITAERCMGVFGGVSVGVTKQKESAHANRMLNFVNLSGMRD